MATERSAFGSWTSPITSQLLVADVVGLSFPSVEDGAYYWIEARPTEAGRNVLVRRGIEGDRADVFGPEFAARTLVHEYGGRCYVVRGSTVYFSNFADQRLYRLEIGKEPVALTPDPPSLRSWRYADPVVSPDGTFLVCVRERHDGDVVNDLVAIAIDGTAEPMVMAEGHDFFSSPTFSRDGRRLAYIAWDHPNMPWDTTLLYEVELEEHAHSTSRRVVVANPDESVIQPQYDARGALIFLSDRTGWWNLYRDTPSGPVALYPLEAEFGRPAWQFGFSDYAPLINGSLVAAWQLPDGSHLGVLDSTGMHEVALDWPIISSVASDGIDFVGLVASPVKPAALVRVDLSSGAETNLATSFVNTVDPAYLSVPQPVEFATESGLTAHALYYAPTNHDFEGPKDEAPPLIVAVHGGPTGSYSAALNYSTQYWTSRGFAVVDVNYGGSAGYGRAYRERLKGAWGIVDLDDCVNAARFLAESDRANPRALLIHGGSAGGYTTLCALTFRDVFATGASYFGLADLGTFVKGTHKFESRYLDGLVGPWPEARAIYEQRSPVFHTDLLRTPMILFQGLEDAVVPPDQADSMAEALRTKGIPFAYLTYEGEQHGFRQAKNIVRTAEAELSFYAHALGFTPADDIESITIENAEAL
ncbi:MAG TPA: prolyl oligopeptidase family serine peptidase [Acidimicrobiales bacterium]|jgi:dipeptidyl aminopeptidase/acylaminoacyl peptidase|nr:prolyl oligopeptidase family serine peptidase [Acidimicrobiales bacterium]